MLEFFEDHSVLLLIMILVAGFVLYAATSAFEAVASTGALIIYFYALFLLGIALSVYLYLNEDTPKLIMTSVITIFVFYNMLTKLSELIRNGPID